MLVKVVDDDEEEQRPRQRQRREEPDSDEEDDDINEDRDDVVESPDGQLIKKLVRYAMACDFSRTPIRRDGIKEKGVLIRPQEMQALAKLTLDDSAWRPKSIFQENIRRGAENPPRCIWHGNGRTACQRETNKRGKAER